MHLAMKYTNKPLKTISSDIHRVKFAGPVQLYGLFKQDTATTYQNSELTRSPNTMYTYSNGYIAYFY